MCATQALRERVGELIPSTQAELREVVEEYGDVVIGEVKVEQVVGGARGIKSMVWLGSNLDANEVRPCRCRCCR